MDVVDGATPTDQPAHAHNAPSPISTIDGPPPFPSTQLAYTLVNKGSKAITSSVVAISLDDHVAYSSSSSKPVGSTGTPADGVVTWANAGSVAIGRSKTYMVETTVGS